YDWLRQREPRWARLAIVHRLDKETSGVLVFGKTPLANRSLTQQFTAHTVRKRYWLLTDRPWAKAEFEADSVIVRVGERYVSRPRGATGARARTRFGLAGRTAEGWTEIQAQPVTGRTHQIRVQAAANGFPILGDDLYGGGPHPRLCLHAGELVLGHPATGHDLKLVAPVEFAADPVLALRQALIDPATTDVFRLVHGAADGWPGWHLDRAGDFLLSQSAPALAADQRRVLAGWLAALGLRGAYHKPLERQVRGVAAGTGSPARVLGQGAPEPLIVRENGLRFELRFTEGYSVGLFFDQRDNRRRLLRNHLDADMPLFKSGLTGRTVLNAFAYTCGFSVCAARAGARVTSLDLSGKYLEWGRRNFALNDLDAAAHEFRRGDVFDWLRRWAKRGQRFDAVLLDPPTFSRSRAHGVFRAEQDYGELVTAALPVLEPGGILFASTNALRLSADAFVHRIAGAIRAGGRSVEAFHYAPQPPDFPITRAMPAHLKTGWWRVD
ncbi:MAG: class I SAM-dependent methyltransferase, partial [Verrucomicrobia bacterium]|nr:class I SAM-dependent methyltransferase [Verrucomicrobiota bacterium]